MTDKLRTIRLYGTLGARFGREFQLAVNSPSEAVRALGTQIPGFVRFLMEAKDRGMAFAVFSGKRNLTLEQLGDPPGDEDIRIAPILQGSKNGGILNIVAGAVLWMVGAYLSLGSGGLLTALGAPLMNLGVAMMLGGVVQMLSPQPKGLGVAERPENRPSYSFNGAVNTQAQGNPVPVGYGECWAGSAVISGGIYAEDQA